MTKNSANSRGTVPREGTRPVAATGAPDWMVASIERAVWCLLAIVAAIMAYLAIT